MTNIRETFRSYLEEKEGVKIPEDKIAPVKNKYTKSEYMQNYYQRNKEYLKEYQHKYYLKNKDRIGNKLSSFQELVYNYDIQNSNNWLVPQLQATAIALWKSTAQIFKTTEILVRKWKLVRVPEWYRIVDWTWKSVLDEKPLFEVDEPQLCESYNKDDYIKKLENDNWELQRRLQNADERYLKLLWEYTDYKKSIETAYINYETAEKVRNDMMWELDQLIMNR